MHPNFNATQPHLQSPQFQSNHQQQQQEQQQQQQQTQVSSSKSIDSISNTNHCFSNIELVSYTKV